jgi:hypothetical protein
MAKRCLGGKPATLLLPIFIFFYFAFVSAYALTPAQEALDKASTYLKEEKYANALNELIRAIQLDNNFIEAYSQRARILLTGKF